MVEDRGSAGADALPNSLPDFSTFCVRGNDLHDLLTHTNRLGSAGLTMPNLTRFARPLDWTGRASMKPWPGAAAKAAGTADAENARKDQTVSEGQGYGAAQSGH